jgi:hypothetical protein
VPGGNGGSGKVVMVEDAGSFSDLTNTSGRWSMRAQFLYKSQNKWSS